MVTLQGAFEQIGEIGNPVLIAAPLSVYQLVSHPPRTEAHRSLSYDYELPAGAIVGSATIRVIAEPAGRTAIANVARVRSSSGGGSGATSSLVIDFGGLRTVSSCEAPRAISSLQPWSGTAFRTDQELAASNFGDVSFTEVATERLLVVLASAVTPDALAAGAVTISDPPADIEVLVAGERVHFSPGPVRGDGARFDTTIDVKDAMQRAVDAGTTPVPIEVRSSVPAQLTIEPEPGAHLDAHRVQFAEGDRHTVSAADEGRVDVVLPLPADATGWRVRLVRFELQGSVGDRRVLPADGPATGGGAEVYCDSDHPLAARLPPASIDPLRTIDAVRLLIHAEQTIELVGYLAAETVGPSGRAEPGDPVPTADLTPVTVEAGGDAEPRWVTLPLKRPAPVMAGKGLWVVVQASRGRAAIRLATGSGDDSTDATVLRRGSNGNYRRLPAIVDVPTGAVPLRVSGVAPPTAPIDALHVSVQGAPAAPTIHTTPGSTPGGYEIGLDTAVTPTGGDPPSLLLQLVVVGPGDHTIGPVTVGYEETS